MNKINHILLATTICLLLFYFYSSSDSFTKSEQISYLSEKGVLLQDQSHQGNDDTMSNVLETVGIPHYTINLRELCNRVSNFVFVKTHKTGSSTMCNILLRFTEIHNLNQLMGMYPSGTEYHDLPSKRYAPPPPLQTYNAFVMHASYNRDFLMSKLPPDTKFFTFIRHPVNRYLSAFHFFNHYKRYNPNDFNDAVQRHLIDNKNYLTSSTNCKHCLNTVNSVARDLGFNFNDYLKATDKHLYLTDFLAKREKEIELVLITEYFDLSLVLLKRKFCWDFEDLVYLRSLESLDKPSVSEETKQQVSEFQAVDKAIYEHYNKTFWDIVEKEDGIYDDLAKFKRVNEAAKSRCVAGKEIGSMNTWKYKLTDFGKTNFQCLAMNTRVLFFSHLIEKRNQGLTKDGPHEPDTLTLKDVYNMRSKQD